MTSSKHIYWLGGGWHDRKEFVIKEITSKKQQSGCEVLIWDKDLDLEGSGQIDFFSPPRLLIVPPKTRIGKKQLESIVAVASEELMLVICETAVAPSTPEITANNAHIVVYPEPKPWEMDAKYGEIFKEILKKRYNKEMSIGLATELVKRIGQDFSLMEKEALKYSVLPAPTLTIDVIANMVAIAPQFETKLLVDAVRLLDPVALMRACNRIEQYATTDQTMGICRGLLGYSVYQWLEAHAMLRERKTVEQVCDALDIKFKSTFERETIPLLNKLGVDGLQELIGLISDCEKAVLIHGVGEPFLMLKYGLLKIINTYSQKGREE
jgi:hypothetical protein